MVQPATPTLGETNSPVSLADVYAISLWPAGISDPNLYFLLRQRQLEYQCRAIAQEGPSAWRRHSASAGRANGLLASRGRPQISLHLPFTRCGVDINDTAVYVRTVDPPPSRPAAAVEERLPLPGGVGAAYTGTAAAAKQPTSGDRYTHSISSGSGSSSGSQRSTCTPPRLAEQPAKRSRLSSSGEATHAPAPPAHRSGPGLAAHAMCMSPLQGHLIAPCMREQSAPLVIAMHPALAAPSCRCSMVGFGSAASRPLSPASSPLVGWLLSSAQRLCGMLTPQAGAVTAC